MGAGSQWGGVVLGRATGREGAMNLREVEESLDRLENQLRACRHHGAQEFRREAQRCRERAARAGHGTERAIWHEAARRLDRGAARELEGSLC